MKYMGSKNRLAKDIVPIIQKYIDDNNIENYLEPFVGGANVIDKIKCKNKYGSDNNEYLIALLNNLDKISTLPNIVTKEHYSKVRECFNNKTKDFELWYIGAIGFLASYNGRFFDGGYAGEVITKTGKVRNYYNEAKRNLINQIDSLKDIKFSYCDYSFYDCEKSKNCLFYLDPPYKNVKQYGTSKNFDNDKFWEWCRKISKNNIVLISEQEAPNDFKCIWEQEVKRTIDNNKRVKVTEKLFIYKGEE